jgi:hypothetical protein
MAPRLGSQGRMLEHAGEPPRWRVYRAGRLPLHALRRGATGGHVWGGGGAGRATCGTGGTSAWAEQQAAMPSWRSRARLRAWEAQARWSEDSSARATKVQSNTKKRRRTHLVEGLAGEEEVARRGALDLGAGIGNHQVIGVVAVASIRERRWERERE